MTNPETTTVLVSQAEFRALLEQDGMRWTVLPWLAGVRSSLALLLGY